MRRIGRIGTRRRAVLALCGLALTAVLAEPAAAQRDCTAGGVTADLQVVTVPSMPNWAFRFEGAPYRTDAQGESGFRTDNVIQLHDRLEPGVAEIPLGPDAVARFVRWHGGRTSCIVTAVFEVDYRMRWVFKDPEGQVVPPSRLGPVTVKSSLGVLTTFSPGEETWLQGSRVVPLFKPVPMNKLLYYVVDRVDVDGQNVVNRSQHKYFPAETRTAKVDTLFYRAEVRARDAFFGFSLGKAVELKYPNGRTRTYALDEEGQVTIDHLPRGDYQMTVDGPGLRVDRPVAMSKHQDVDLKVFSYLDIAVLVLVGLGAIALLIWNRVRHRRRQPEAGPGPGGSTPVLAIAATADQSPQAGAGAEQNRIADGAGFLLDALRARPVAGRMLSGLSVLLARSGSACRHPGDPDPVDDESYALVGGPREPLE